MVKRRRERDKPKAGPEALYNPNKRVLLSYASDEEEVEEEALPAAEELVAMRASATAYDAAEDAEAEDLDDVEVEGDVSNYQMTEYPDEESEEAGDEEVEEEESEVLVDEWAKTKRKDPTTNQWTSLGPPPPDTDEEDEYDPDTEEAMAYLRAVRSERQTIPEILSATHQMQADADHVEGVAASSLPTPPMIPDQPTVDAASITVEADDKTDPQKVFTRRLLDRFYLQRAHLQVSPTAEQLANLTDAHLISFPADNIKAFHEWQRVLSSRTPHLAQLRCMDQDSVINLLGVVQRHHIAKSHDITAITSAWIWALLTRLDDVGTMTNDQVYPLRELGKKALLVLLSHKSPAIADQLEATLGVGDDPGEEIQAVAGADPAQDANVSVETSASVQEVPMPAMASENTLATLDMILVVVGQAFGQKDLLDCRLPWTAAAATAIE
ncbi:unnamed protein product [Zymoseptoria tritici ST99CH_1A5]|uniref:Uncharacterized protein n=1 Tax=Zymoseptoria tritici ST99CH_1A5 TaxID=1276529 RepID=A0A1Y6LZB9_ZYMTR|nr:unnamed protein product [Zymoseptoria tritici ST99CH_1A5]